MSRIGGIYSENIDKNCILKMMQSIQSLDSWQIREQNLGQCSLGFIGASETSYGKTDRILTVIDGHIYNYQEFGAEDNYGKIFIQLYEKYGFEEALKKINGDFGIALYDAATNELWLGRDRLGIKPLYYFNAKGFLAFSSRLKSFSVIPNLKLQANKNFVARFGGMHYRYIDNKPEESPYQDIHQVRAGHCVHWKNGELREKSYWDLKELPDWEEGAEVLAEKYQALLQNAVKLRLNVAPKVGFTLSGGMDSSSVLSSAKVITGEKQQAFSTVYVDKTYDESDEIQSMLDGFVAHWHRIEIDIPDVFPLIDKMIDINDEPIATATWLSHYLLCEQVSQKGFGSLFGGLGGDELNAGEYEHFFFHFADLVRNGKQEAFEQEVAKWVEYHDHPIFKKNMDVAKNALSRMVDLNSSGKCLVEQQRFQRYLKAINKDYFDLANYVPEMKHPFNSYLKNRTYQDIFYETAPCCLRAEDRQTMAFGLGNFLPFFDYRLVEFMFRLPGEMKINQGVTKILLREAMKNILPDETRQRIKKTGWNAPAHQWFMGKDLDRVRDMVNSSSFQQRGIYNTEVVNQIINEHEEIISQEQSRDNHMMFLWQLVNMELWLSRIK